MQVSDEMIEAGSEVLWNDRDARMGGPWKDRDPNEVCVIQTKATMRAALTAALALSGWRTIDSAPKNGTPFLAWESEERGPFKCWMQTDWPRSEVYWTDAADSEPAPKFWKPLDAPPATAGKEG